MSGRPEATVVVITRDRAASLERCLRSLLADPSAVPREVLVVDNGSSDGTPDVVARLAAAAPWPVRRVPELREGHQHARNAGVREAAGTLVLFADDDVTVHPGWADALAAAFEEPDVLAAGGRVLPVFGGPEPPWLDGPQRDNVALADRGGAPFDCDASWLPYTANAAFRRAALPPVPFHPRLGRTGSATVSFEEWHLLRTLLPRGRVVYRPDAVVDHHVDPARLTLAGVRRRHFQVGFGAARSGLLLDELERPGVARGAVRSARAGAEARRRRRRNAHAGPTDGQAAWDELYAYFWFGRSLELLAGRHERLADLLARRLVRP